jgi:hypothetical protein
VPVGSPPLDNKSLDHTVKLHPVIETLASQENEIVDCDGSILRKQLYHINCQIENLLALGLFCTYRMLLHILAFCCLPCFHPYVPRLLLVVEWDYNYEMTGLIWQISRMAPEKKPDEDIYIG